MIIALNTDPQAAIISNCDYYAVADLFEVLTELQRQLATAAAREP
jgi:electron transfer flavoprotein alpha subunit